MSDHPKFEAFKAERLKDPEIKAAYDEAVARYDLAAILAKHWHQHPMQTHDGYHPNACSCGEPIDDPGILAPLHEAMTIHRAHVAQMVLESDWLRDVKADAWDEGRFAEADARGDVPLTHSTGNPHRADRVDAEDGGGE